MSVPKVTWFAHGFALLAAIQAPAAWAQHPFLSDAEWSALRHEAGGTAPYENLRALTRLHRVPATAEFDQAASYMQDRIRDAVSGELGPIPLDVVSDYLKACEEAKVIAFH
jgi:hypothetical protein